MIPYVRSTNWRFYEIPSKIRSTTGSREKLWTNKVFLRNWLYKFCFIEIKKWRIRFLKKKFFLKPDFKFYERSMRNFFLNFYMKLQLLRVIKLTWMILLWEKVLFWSWIFWSRGTQNGPKMSFSVVFFQKSVHGTSLIYCMKLQY